MSWLRREQLQVGLQFASEADAARFFGKFARIYVIVAVDRILELFSS